jgi:hypothetical protein
MKSINIEIETAIFSGNRLIEIYARLRSNIGMSERTDLLRQADGAAEQMGGCLRRIAEGKAAIKDNAQASAGLQALGELIERVMVQEREYRLASGDCSELNVDPEGEKEMSR